MGLRKKISGSSLLAIRHLIYRQLRHLQWRIQGTRFSRRRTSLNLEFPHNWSEFSCPVVNHPSQSAYLEPKVENMKLAVGRIDELVLGPGEVFSFWRILERPSERKGFRRGPTFSNGKVTTSVGGGLCQISGLLFNLALEAGLLIEERHSHTLDAYGERRYLPLGRDATVAWLSKDLAFRNPFPVSVQIRLWATQDKAWGEINGETARAHSVQLEVSPTNAESNGAVSTHLHQYVSDQNGDVRSSGFRSSYKLVGD